MPAGNNRTADPLLRHNPIVKFAPWDTAGHEMLGLEADPAGVAIMTKKLQYGIKLHALDSRAAAILKQEMLARGGDAAVHRGVLGHTVAVSDALILGSAAQLESMAVKIKDQPFGLPAAAEAIVETLRNYERRAWKMEWEHAGKRHNLSPGERPLIMGILNVTPDSFWDGGRFHDPDAAVERGMKMADEGADIIDVGGESTRPFSDPVPVEEEIRRVVPVIEKLAGRVRIPVSIDTRKPGTARAALDAGASMINDVNALRARGMAGLAAEADVPVVLMHMKGTPGNMQASPAYDNVNDEIMGFLRQRIVHAVDKGVDPGRIIVDPGIGFGKTVGHNLSIIKNLHQYRSLGRPVLIGASRKSFIGNTLELDAGERLEGSLAMAAAAVMGGAAILRCHDVGETRRAVDMVDAVMNAKN